MQNTGRAMADDWIIQRDLESRITEPRVWEEEFIPVFQERDSYIEHYVGYCFPLGPQQARQSLRDTNWGYDAERSKPQIARCTENDFLSCAFRKFARLRGRGPLYRDEEGNLIARHEIKNTFVKEKSLFVRRDKVIDFLNAKRKVLLFCFRSHRFSEKSLDELGTHAIYETYRDTNWHYIKERRDISDGQNRSIFERHRANTFSSMFGKSLIIAPQSG